ncbi:MAG TPA: hypothetical protein EYP30_07480 [Archaeoglobaceae archaeon]|nr:hypothetical protein [Archaeoglobaceae archaeon]
MRNVLWYGIADEEKIDYLKKFSVGIIGSRMLMEILWRSGIGCIRYIGDYITPVDARIDASIKPLEANSYDVVHPMSHDTCIISYLYPGKHSELRKQLKGVDLVIAHKYLDEGARVAEELGSPFMPDFITTFLPDGLSFFEIEYPSIEHNPVSYSLTCSFQAGEVMNIFTGQNSPAIAPDAYIVDLKAENYIRKIRLCLKEK